MSEPKTTPPVYLDTSVAIAATIEGLPFSRDCRALGARLADAGNRVVFSQILRLEYSQVVARLPLGGQLPPETRQAFRLDRGQGDGEVRARWMRFGVEELERWLDQFPAVSEVAFDYGIWTASVPLMARYRLASHDAIHVATARQAHVSDFATLDSDFRRVPDLQMVLVRE